MKLKIYQKEIVRGDGLLSIYNIRNTTLRDTDVSEDFRNSR